MADGVAAETMSPAVRPAAVPEWAAAAVQTPENLVWFSVAIEGAGPRWIALGPDTTDATVCVFETGPRRRLVVLCDRMAARASAFLAGHRGPFRRFNLRKLFRLGISNEAWARLGAGTLWPGAPRYSEHVGLRRLFAGPAAPPAGTPGENSAVVAGIRERFAEGHPGDAAGVLPPPHALARYLTDPLDPPERASYEAGLYVPALPPGSPPAAADAVRISTDGASVVFPDLLIAVEVLGPVYAAVVRGFVSRRELQRLCARQREPRLELDDIPATVAWALAPADGSPPTTVPARVAFELLRNAAQRWLRRWAARAMALCEAVVAPAVYSVAPRRRGSSAAISSDEAYTGRGRRVSVTSPTGPAATSLGGAFGGAEKSASCTTVIDETGEASGVVETARLVPIKFEPGCPGAGIPAEYTRHVRIMLSMEGTEAGLLDRPVSLSRAGVVGTLPICMTACYEDPVTGRPVDLTDRRRLHLAKVLYGLSRRDRPQTERYRSLLQEDVRRQGLMNRGRMAEVMRRGRAPTGIWPCSGCQLSTWSTCFRALYDGRALATVPEPPEGSTVVDLVCAVKKANAELAVRKERAAAKKAEARARRAARSARGAAAPKRARKEVV
jgi:hypothetical protein